ncbi:hypothetical protein GCM10017044_06500 [Kordiimonas sediminis]|uniref:Pirin family protein n=1 Tax=Kordiimonas sediminis TaxID=1735581 RepID=A0A919ALV1_9PROT|nr:pirin family protein [Kordiimonas sediminis]GHF15059.1 hypothetical protein GCM10017044_06500 [Kordiimonas sediminis]
MTIRSIISIMRAHTQNEGAGATVHRTVGARGLMNLDPFLLLDEFELKAGKGGFPNHPHRGFETVTYMLQGAIEHKDNKGNQGIIRAGDAQWMTAGRGLIHSEMPKSTNGETVHGLQLWVNLPAANKMDAPRYQDVVASDLPQVTEKGFTVKVLSGTYAGQTGPVSGLVLQPQYLDIRAESDSLFEHTLPTYHQAFIYVLTGSVRIGKSEGLARDLLILSEGDTVSLNARAGTRFILVSAAKTEEPVARYGPFVMNTRAEIEQAITDYNSGRF